MNRRAFAMNLNKTQKEILMDLERLKNTPRQDIDTDLLVDINTIKIDNSLDKEEKMLSFLEQIKNPYLYKCDDVIVRLTFDDNAPTLEEKLISHFKSLI